MESMTLPALEVDLKVKEVKDMIAILEKLSEKENQNTDGVFFLLNIEGTGNNSPDILGFTH